MSIFYFAFFLFFVSPLMAQQTGWQPNPDLVKQLQQDRPEYIWDEQDVPDYELPDALAGPDGSQARSPEEWQQQREQILEKFRELMFGYRPERPDAVYFDPVEEDGNAMEGTATLKQIAVRSEYQGRSHRFELILFLPNDISGPVPVFLLINNRDRNNTDPSRGEKSGFWPAEDVISRGYGVAAIQNSHLAPDSEENYHEGVIRLYEGEAAASDRPPDAWMALSAWGWGATRVMDYFERDPDVDESRVALLGHSRGGKAALWAGAEDERFSLVISNDSGAGGAALSRRNYGETVEAVNRFGHWFTGNFEQFNGREAELPVDQHMLISLIAPRAVYVASADEDLWADPRGEFLALAHASPVYALWNYPPLGPDEMPSLNTPLFNGPRGYHIRSGGHNLTPVDWGYFMDFADQLWE